jgi:protein-tyrosine phosphatase
MSERTSVLFVCLGNICRSPLAEAVFRDLIEREGLSERFTIDSAGTSNYHIGEQPDERTVSTAAARGVKLSHAARQITRADLEQFDYVIAMDASNLGRVQRIAGGSGRAQLRLLRSFDQSAVRRDDLEVPDPYFGGADGFTEVHDMVERACAGLLHHVMNARE